MSLVRCSNSPESGLGTSHTSLPDSESDEDQPDSAPEPQSHAESQEVAESEADVSYGDDPLPVLGQAKALYAFDGELLCG